MNNRIDLKERISIIITAINFATHMMPFFIMMPLLSLVTIFSNELEIEWLGTILVAEKNHKVKYVDLKR